MSAFTMTPPAPTFVAPAEAPLPAPSESVEDESTESRDHGLVALTDLLRAREFSQIDVALLKEAAFEVGTIILTTVREVDYAAVGAAVSARAVELLETVLSRRPEISVPSVPKPHLAIPRPHATAERAPKPPKAPKPEKIREVRVASVKAEKAPRGPSRIHVRWRRVLFRGVCLAIIATTVAVMPAEAWPRVASDLSAFGAQALVVGGDVASQAVKVGGDLADQATKIGGGIKTEIEQRVASSSGAPAPLRKATFELPPLSEYGASLDSKAPDPSARPDATVEWVVALKNTGSAGWYRGIDGAQASLALSDGTSAGVQSTDFVGPGQIGWFVVKLHAPAKPGTYDIALLPRIDGRGSLKDLGIKAKLTVTAP